MQYRHLAVAGIVAAALTFAGCSDDKDESTDTTNPPATQPSATNAPPSGDGLTVKVTNFAFSIPGPATAGVAITIVNDDPFSHTFSDAGGAFNVSLSGGATETLTIDEAGTYNVVCQIHPQMTASLTVD